MLLVEKHDDGSPASARDSENGLDGKDDNKLKSNDEDRCPVQPGPISPPFQSSEADVALQDLILEEQLLESLLSQEEEKFRQEVEALEEAS